MDAIIQKLWSNYLHITPTVKKVENTLQLDNYSSFYDHIAFRTLNTKQLGLTKRISGDYGIEKLSKKFLSQGYTIQQEYILKKEKLKAIHLEKDNAPKIFISELLVDQCSFFLKNTLLKAFDTCKNEKDILTKGRCWDVNYKVYKELERESEYAAWLYVHGHRVNHFTINVNQLEKKSIEDVCTQLKTSGIHLNNCGGVIKGGKNLGLKQASTIADTILVNFKDLKETIRIPSCYVEFTERFNTDKQVFNGFIANSAGKIFQSSGRIVA